MIKINRLVKSICLTIAAIVAVAAMVSMIGIHFTGRLAAASPYYEKYIAYRDDFGPVRYSTINYQCSAEERSAVSPVLATAESVFAYVGPAAGVDENVGALARYYFCTDESPFVSADFDLQLITAKIDGESGCMWVVYSNARYGRDGAVVNGSRDIVCYWEIRKIGGRWIVVDVVEPA